eukprot:CAMPEP_0176121482 /NCGR_PEP_ID=MMETSP0120_2-20121206/61150_1 /TAXON_ID=160619 /ORGANISM="Kryptoperidinium foliaceum, Strain CCMP 1326" /LENGTH=44 /DNA_ID= /DNA_START= /DNA_END= /DNA_ORIENTATION=
MPLRTKGSRRQATWRSSSGRRGPPSTSPRAPSCPTSLRILGAQP